jgi:hypothetical protein
VFAEDAPPAAPARRENARACEDRCTRNRIASPRDDRKGIEPRQNCVKLPCAPKGNCTLKVREIRIASSNTTLWHAMDH